MIDEWVEGGDRLLRMASARANIAITRRWAEPLKMWFVIEFPKSGGTWVARMLSDYLRLPFPQESRLPIAMPAVMHAHWRYDPRLPRVFYVYRDGRDVLTSLYFHVQRNRGRVLPFSRSRELLSPSATARSKRHRGKDDIETFVEEQFLRPRGSPLPWHEHVAQWVGRPSVYGVSYERLLREPFTALAEGLEFFGCEVDHTRLAETVERESFERVTGRQRGQEDTSHFARKGVAGDWRNYFTPGAATLFEEHAGPMLDALGYQQASGRTSTGPAI